VPSSFGRGKTLTPFLLWRGQLVLTAPALSRIAAWGGGFPIKVDGEIVGAIGISGAPTVQNDVDCAKAALAVVSDGWLAA
jgi:uncharacterized protein GlcG (DUF336 family)